jgi:hypothetical protein
MSERWYIVRQVGGRQKKFGPMTLEQLRQLASAGKLKPDDLACVEGMESWVPVADLGPLLGPQLPASPPALPPVPQPQIWAEPIVVTDCRSVVKTARHRPRGNFYRKPLVLVAGSCLATALVVGLILALAPGKSADSRISPKTVQPGVSSPGTITFALHVDPTTFATRGEGNAFTTGWIHMVIRTARPFGDSKLVVSYNPAGTAWRVLDEFVVDPNWDTATTKVNLVDPGTYRVRATTSRGDVLAEGTVYVTIPNYGTPLTYGGNVLYYVAPVTEAEARRLGEYLSTAFFREDTQFAVQLRKSGRTYEFRRCLKKGLENDPEIIDSNKRWCREMSQVVFGGAPVDIHFCDEHFATLRVVIDTNR